MTLNISTAVIVINTVNTKKKAFSEQYLDRENKLFLLTNPNILVWIIEKKMSYIENDFINRTKRI